MAITSGLHLPQYIDIFEFNLRSTMDAEWLEAKEETEKKTKLWWWICTVKQSEWQGEITSKMAEESGPFWEQKKPVLNFMPQCGNQGPEK